MDSPDPEAVRRALEAIDAVRREYHRGDETYNGFVYRAALQLSHLEAAARAWLAQQDALDSRPFHWTSH